MRCKKHYTDLSSAIGVCACCLRERLLFLIAAQEQSSSLSTNTTSFHHHSVSPFVNHRKSDPNHHAPRHHHTFSDQLLYQTPQLNPKTASAAAGDISGAIPSHKKRSFIRFFSFQNIFRSRNRNPVDPPDDGDIATSSASWFSVIYKKRHRRKKTASVDETAAAVACDGGVRRQCGNRGMSPVRTSEYNEDELCTESVNGYESTESWKNTPRRTPMVKRGGGHVRNLSYCLSPLVRASPNRQRNNKGLQPDGGLSGEIRAPVKPHLLYTKSFCANRSRKLADFGRANLNR